jgi:hypothetical protein
MTGSQAPVPGKDLDGLNEDYRRVREVDRDCSLEAVRRYMQEIAEMERAIDRLLAGAPRQPGPDSPQSPQGAEP